MIARGVPQRFEQRRAQAVATPFRPPTRSSSRGGRGQRRRAAMKTPG